MYDSLKIHLGCNTFVIPGWINLDVINITHPDYYKWDLRQGLPSNFNNIAAVNSEHFFEHLTFEESQQLMKDCYNRMKVGGVFYMALPNFRQLIERFIANDFDFFSHVRHVAPHNQMMQYINDSLYQRDPHTGIAEHKQMFTVEYALFQLELAGFKDCKEVGFNPEFNKPDRRPYTFYVQGIK